MNIWNEAAAYGWANGQLANKPIALQPEGGEAPAPIFTGERFAEARDGKGIEIRLMYPALGMRNACGRCLMRESVLVALRRAAALLPPGYRIRAWDAWRPLALQKELYTRYRDEIIRAYGIGDRPDAERDAFVSKFVVRPSEDREDPPAHTTGARWT